jgi:hypothetical protein
MSDRPRRARPTGMTEYKYHHVTLTTALAAASEPDYAVYVFAGDEGSTKRFRIGAGDSLPADALSAVVVSIGAPPPGEYIGSVYLKDPIPDPPPPPPPGADALRPPHEPPQFGASLTTYVAANATFFDQVPRGWREGP